MNETVIEVYVVIFHVSTMRNYTVEGAFETLDAATYAVKRSVDVNDTDPNDYDIWCVAGLDVTRVAVAYLY